MSIQKLSEKSLISVNNNIFRHKEYIDQLSKLTSTETVVFWGALKTILIKSKDDQGKVVMALCKEKNSESAGTTLANIKFLMGVIAEIEETIDLVDKTEDKIAEATARITSLEKQSAEIKLNLEAQ